MAAPSMTVKGLPELEAKLAALGKLPKREFNKILKKGAVTIWRDMLPRIPVDEGDLKKAMSKQTNVVKIGKRSRVSVSYRAQMPERSKLPKITGKGYYPAAVEFGSRTLGRRNARPFMRPAFDAKKDDVLKQARRDLGKAIEVEGRKRAAKRG